MMKNNFFWSHYPRAFEQPVCPSQERNICQFFKLFLINLNSQGGGGGGGGMGTLCFGEGNDIRN